MFSLQGEKNAPPLQIFPNQFLLPNFHPCSVSECPFSVTGKLHICKLHFGHPSKELAESDPRFNFFYCGEPNCSYGSALAKHFHQYHKLHSFNCGQNNCTFLNPNSSYRCPLHYIHKLTCLSPGCILTEKGPFYLCEKHTKPKTDMDWFMIKGGMF